MVVGRYALFGEIASGGMASVHFGRLLGPIGFSRPVAIKRLHAQLAKDESVRAMFIDEARLAARIHHPNVVQTLDVIHEGDELLLVMEYVHGEALAKLARSVRRKHERVPVPIALSIVASTLHGLHAAHEAKGEDGVPLNIVHRDVSPQNILVGADGVVRVLDFGIARAEHRLESTKEGIVKGKLAYMAPEQLVGGAMTRSVDVFAAGIVLWELLAGKRLLFKGEDGDSVMIEKLLRGEFEPPSQVAPGVPKALDAITLKALERDPLARYASARDMALAIEAYGNLATTTQIADWVEKTASEALAERSARLAEFERSSARLRTGMTPPGGFEPDRASGSLAAHTTASTGNTPYTGRVGSTLDPPVPVTIPAPAIKRQWVRASFIGAAFVALAFGLGGAGLATALNHRSSAQLPAAEAPVRVVTPPPPPKPTCPMGMQTIPGGRFFMGSDDDLPMEKPAHNVTLAAYCMDTYEVTTISYQSCSDRGECKRAGTTNDWDGITEQEHKTYDPLCNVRDAVGRGQHPINCVDWENATIYCKAQGKSLPTEAQWEFAARGPDGRKYPWGDETPSSSLLNACGKECLGWAKKNRVELAGMYDSDDGYPNTAPVGSFPKGASRYGVQDVVGNVWEWVSDYYATYDKEDQVDPKGPENGDEHVIRGGAWNGAYPSWVRPTFRYKDAADKRSYGIGFRCAKALQ
jgi:serine/threonine-protein kinase